MIRLFVVVVNFFYNTGDLWFFASFVGLNYHLPFVLTFCYWKHTNSNLMTIIHIDNCNSYYSKITGLNRVLVYNFIYLNAVRFGGRLWSRGDWAVGAVRRTRTARSRRYPFLVPSRPWTPYRVWNDEVDKIIFKYAIKYCCVTICVKIFLNQNYYNRRDYGACLVDL